MAGIIGLLLPAYFIIPWLHFYPYFSPLKGILAGDVQSFFTVFVSFISTKDIGVNYPLYVGWIPVLLAAVSIWRVPKASIRLLIFFMAAILLICALSTKEPITFLTRYISALEVVRLPSLISVLAVPLVIGLAAWGLDLLVKIAWPKVSWTLGSGKAVSISIGWLVIILPLIFAIKELYPIGTQWMFLDSIGRSEVVAQAVQASSVQWIEVPTTDYVWPTLLVQEYGDKMTNVFHPWQWKDRLMPLPSEKVVSIHDELPVDPGGERVATIGEYTIYRYPAVQYASIQTSTGVTPCQSTATGGLINVTCNNNSPGQLVIQENAFPGWMVWVDGKIASLISGQWLAVAAPVGKHVYQFRYLPLDIVLGVFVSFLGLFLAVLGLTGHPKAVRTKLKRILSFEDDDVCMPGS